MMPVSAFPVLSSAAIPLPYTPRMDGGLTLVLLGCFLLSSYVLSRNRKFLMQLGKDFISTRERASIFTTSTMTDIRYLSLLVLQTCILLGVCIFNYFIDVRHDLLEHVQSILLLGIYVLAVLLYLFAKWLIYSVIGWTFFDKERTSVWFESYSTLLYYSGFPLFLFALFSIYFDLNQEIMLVWGLILAICVKILIFYKWIKLFCDNLYGGLLLILYFCALEAMPYFLMYRGLLQINELLIIKF